MARPVSSPLARPSRPKVMNQRGPGSSRRAVNTAEQLLGHRRDGPVEPLLVRPALYADYGSSTRRTWIWQVITVAISMASATTLGTTSRQMPRLWITGLPCRQTSRYACCVSEEPLDFW